MKCGGVMTTYYEHKCFASTYTDTKADHLNKIADQLSEMKLPKHIRMNPIFLKQMIDQGVIGYPKDGRYQWDGLAIVHDNTIPTYKVVWE
jgi:hypothetical protein